MGGRDVDASSLKNPMLIYVLWGFHLIELQSTTTMITPNHIECPDVAIPLNGALSLRSPQAVTPGLLLFWGVAISNRPRRIIVPGRHK